MMCSIDRCASVQLDYKGFGIYLDFIGEGDRSVYRQAVWYGVFDG